MRSGAVDGLPLLIRSKSLESIELGWSYSTVNVVKNSVQTYLIDWIIYGEPVSLLAKSSTVLFCLQPKIILGRRQKGSVIKAVFVPEYFRHNGQEWAYAVFQE